MPRRATAQDVADLAGVSRSSVSLVLNGRAEGNISLAKQQAVLDAARQLDYRPNALALSLRSRRTRTIGVLTWQGALGFPEMLLHAASVAATEAGYLLILMDTGDDRERELRAVTTLLDRQVDGFIVVAPELVDYRPLDEMQGTPTLLVNCTDPDQAFTSVSPDEFGAGQAAAAILISLGHRRIGLLADYSDTVQARNRIDGVRAALESAGLPPPVLLTTARQVDSGAAATRRALLGGEQLTALVCTHERLALGALLAAAELRLDVPTELSVVSLDDGEKLAAELVPSLTTVQRPDQAMAEQAVAIMVADLTSGTESAVRQLSFVCPPDLRDSTAPAQVGFPADRW